MKDRLMRLLAALSAVAALALAGGASLGASDSELSLSTQVMFPEWAKRARVPTHWELRADAETA